MGPEEAHTPPGSEAALSPRPRPRAGPPCAPLVSPCGPCTAGLRVSVFRRGEGGLLWSGPARGGLKF